MSENSSSPRNLKSASRRPRSGPGETNETIDRRTFLHAGAGLAGAALLPASAGAGPPPAAAQTEPWYRRAFRRNVIDVHITDLRPEFLSEYDPDQYVQTLKLSQVQSAIVYAHSHVGLCNFPTKVGRTHRGMQGKDHLARVVEGCQKNGIAVVLYFSAIFDRWAYENHPDWRIVLANGKEAAEHNRHGLCCPNSPYRDYAAGIVGEIVSAYKSEGIRIDMTFWPTTCYCRHCRNRFASEVGGKLPTTINWEDPHWVSFQRKREEWLTDFATLLTSTAKKIRPEVTVEHQSSSYPADWRRGVTEDLVPQNDFLQGDFYGDALQGSFVRKLFYSLSPNLPYGFETSVMVSIRNHTAKKSADLLRTKSYASLADGGAFVFIDAIDPVGTVNKTVYQHMGRVFEETKRYEPFLGGDLCQDVGIYFSTWSKCDFADNGKRVDDPSLSKKAPHVDAALGVCQTCRSRHIPYGIICKKNLGDLSRYRVVALPNVLMMDEEEIEAIRNYVRNGGNVYASKYSSLVTKNGSRQEDFLLADVFGLSYEGETEENYTYIAPTEDFEEHFAGYSRKYPLGLGSSQLRVAAKSGARVLGTLTMPYTDPADPSRYASIHSNPPGIATSDPAVVLHRFGKGKVLYVAGEIESSELYADIVANFIRMLGGDFCFEAQAPQSVEVTAFRQAENNRIVVNLVNFPKDLPSSPVDGIKMKLNIGGREVKRVVLLPDGTAVDHESAGGRVSFEVPRMETFAMLAVDFA